MYRLVLNSTKSNKFQRLFFNIKMLPEFRMDYFCKLLQIIITMKKSLILSLFLIAGLFGFSQNDVAIHHTLHVQINPAVEHIAVIDSLFNVGTDELVFSLNASLTPTSFSKNVKAEQIDFDADAKDVGMDRDDSERRVVTGFGRIV